MLYAVTAALALAIVAFVLASMAMLSARRLVAASRSGAELDGVPEDVEGLRREVAALKADSAGAFRHLAVVRYDAFGDVGGQLSWSVALLDDSGDGIVLSSIHGRTEARTYAKSISTWSCDQPLSPEEEEAVIHARPA